MLALSPLGSSTHGEEIRESDVLLEDISFDDLFEGFEDGDILPDLEIDPADIFADFSFSSGEESGNTTAVGGGEVDKVNNYSREEEDEIIRVSKDLGREVEVVSARTKEEDGVGKLDKSSSSHESGKGRKSSGHNSKGSQGKKKAKVDWTPELHRRFVQAVEQLGVDKAVPSRILELMGIDCLTRHNIASHLQKYRSHRKHLLAREAEAASWSHRRQMYSNRHAHAGGGVGAKMNMNPNWVGPPIMGFPPPIQHPTLRPLHVWGHPTAVDHQQPQLVPMWPRPPWAPHRPPHAPMPDPSYWHHPLYQRPLIQGTPCFPQLMPTTFQRYPAPPVPGIPPHPMYRAPQQPPPPPPPHNTPTPPPSRSTGSLHTQLGAAQPTSENIDAAIGDVLAKPWSPLPLGLKPPSLESVMVELQKQGVPQVPPTCSG